MGLSRKQLVGYLRLLMLNVSEQVGIDSLSEIADSTFIVFQEAIKY
jgi:hypothetical protein